MNRFLFSGLVLGLLATATQAQAASLVLDDFTVDGDLTLTSPGSDSATFTGPTENILGGTRTVSLTGDGGEGGSVTFSDGPCTAVVPPITCGQFSSDTGVLADFGLTYGDENALGDVTEGGILDTIVLTTAFSDFATSLTVTATDTTGSASSTVFTPSGIFFPTTGTDELEISFSDFVGIDFTNLVTLDFDFDAFVPATDLEISLISFEDLAPNPPVVPPVTHVPEPSAVLALIATVGAFATFKKKRSV